MSEAIYPGTTPTLTFKFPAEIVPTECLKIALVLTQGNRQVLNLTCSPHNRVEPPWSISGQEVSVKLSQENTRSFTPCVSLALELWVKTGSGNVPDPWQTSIPVGMVQDSGAI